MLNHKSCKWWLLEKRGIIAKSCKKRAKSVEKPEFLSIKSCKLTVIRRPAEEVGWFSLFHKDLQNYLITKVCAGNA